MLPRSLCTLLAIVALFVAFLSPTPARADDTPLPFEMEFPQEVAATTFHDDWRARRSGGRRHSGNDLMAPKMTEVYAIADGVVAKVGTSRRAGRYLVIEHLGGWDSYYIHLNNDNPGTDDGDADWSLTVAPGVEKGATLIAGQVIGYAGDSGNAEGTMPHTHFEMHLNGSAINPHSYLVQAYERALAKAERLAWIDEYLLVGLQIV